MRLERKDYSLGMLVPMLVSLKTVEVCWQKLYQYLMSPFVWSQIKGSGIQPLDCNSSNPSIPLLHVGSTILHWSRIFLSVCTLDNWKKEKNYTQFAYVFTGNPTVMAKRVMWLVPSLKFTAFLKTKLFSTLLPCPNPAKKKRGRKVAVIRLYICNIFFVEMPWLHDWKYSYNLSLPIYSPFTNATIAWPRLATTRTGRISRRIGKSTLSKSMLQAELQKQVRFHLVKCTLEGIQRKFRDIWLLPGAVPSIVWGVFSQVIELHWFLACGF